MELDDCITKDCSTIYRFQFASIAFICGVYLPFTFHANIWSLYVQPFAPVNCTATRTPLLLGLSSTNLTNKTLTNFSIKTSNRTDCCGCQSLLYNGNIHDKRLLIMCQDWLTHLQDYDVRKATILDEVSVI